MTRIVSNGESLSETGGRISVAGPTPVTLAQTKLPKVWTVANQKGGVGKTTTVVTLSGILASQGKRVLMIDLDPQGSLSSYFDYNPEKIQESVYQLFLAEQLPPFDKLRSLVQEAHFDNLQLLPASCAMATLDRKLGARTGKGLVVKDLIRKLATLFDHVLIDCSPSLGILLVNALAACDQIVIPVQTEFLAIKGLERMHHTLQMISRSTGRELPYVILPTMYDRRTRASGQSLEQLRRQFGGKIWEPVIPVNTEFREASRTGIPLSLRSPHNRGVQAYRELCEHLLQLEANTKDNSSGLGS